MDAYTLIVAAVLFLAIQALIAHSVFTLYANEGDLRETITRQGTELLRLKQRLEELEAATDATETAEDEAPLADPTLEELIARYERDERASLDLLHQAVPGDSTTAMRIN